MTGVAALWARLRAWLWRRATCLCIGCGAEIQAPRLVCEWCFGEPEP